MKWAEISEKVLKMKDEMLTLTQEWDKTFPKSDKVDRKKDSFHNRCGITLASICTFRFKEQGCRKAVRRSYYG